MRQVDSGRDLRNAIIFIGGVAVVGVIAIANPELAKSFAGSVGKDFLTRVPKPLVA